MSERLTNSVGRLGQSALRREVPSLHASSKDSSNEPPHLAPKPPVHPARLTDIDGSGLSTAGPLKVQQSSSDPLSIDPPASAIRVSVDRIMMMMPGTRTFQASQKDFVEVEHRAELAIPEGTITMQFRPRVIWGRRTLFSKDAAHTATPGHLTAWVHDGRIEARLTSLGKTVTIQTDRGTVAVGKTSWLAVTFGPNGLRVYLDGILSAVKETCRQGWEHNFENLLIGANGWRRKPTQPFDTRDYFDGEISDLTIYDRQLAARELAKSRSITSQHAPSAPA